MPITNADISNNLERYGWSNYEELESGVLITGFHGVNGSFLICFASKENWLTIKTAKYLPRISSEKLDAVCKILVDLNNTFPYIRVTIVAGVVTITADIPQKNNKIDFNLFKIAMDLICEAADEFYPSLYELVTA